MSIEVRVHDHSITEDPAFQIAGDKTTKVIYVDTSSYWKDQRFDYTTGNLDYRGCNITHKAGTDAETWYIWKYTWSGGNLLHIEGPLIGAWDNRATLNWE